MFISLQASWLLGTAKPWVHVSWTKKQNDQNSTQAGPLSRPLSLSSNSWKVLCTHPYKRWKLYKNESQKKSRSRLENWDEMTEFLALVSKPEIRWKNSRARLEARDWKKENLDLVSKRETGRKKFSIPSRTRDWKTDILDPVSKVETGLSLDTRWTRWTPRVKPMCKNM